MAAEAKRQASKLLCSNRNFVLGISNFDVLVGIPESVVSSQLKCVVEQVFQNLEHIVSEVLVYCDFEGVGIIQNELKNVSQVLKSCNDTNSIPTLLCDPGFRFGVSTDSGFHFLRQLYN